MLRVYCIKAGVQRLDIKPNALTISFSKEHREKSFDSINTALKNIAVFEFIKKETIKIQLGSKKNKISRAVLEARNILKAIS